MTDTEVGIEAVAQQIAAGGQAALVERMRTAYRTAAATHADLISLDGERIEDMVQAAAGRADGLQWRRALATVAAGQLGISATQALTHPAVARAQALVGAPSYEQGLAALIATPAPPAPPAASTATAAPESPAAPATTAPANTATPEPAPELESAAPEPVAVPEPAPRPAPAPGSIRAPAPPPRPAALPRPASDSLPARDALGYETQAYDVEAAFGAETLPAHDDDAGRRGEGDSFLQQPDEDDYDALSFSVIHEGGVANLPKRREGLGVHISADGLDIFQGENEIIGRLLWDEIETLQVVSLRPRRRRPEARCRLIVRTPQGDASFAVPEITGEELRSRIDPLFARYGKSH